jgi:ribosome recycling factor
MNDDINLVLAEAEEKMDKAVDHLNNELLTIRAGKASSHMLDGIMVEYYGSQTPLSHVANIAVPDARTITIQPWEKNIMGDIEKAILVANIGLTPMNNGELIRLSIPPLTEERRKELVKNVRAEGENARVSIRNARRDAIDAFKKLQKDGLSEDMAKDAEGEAQKLTDKFSGTIDKILGAKEEDIMTI